MGEFIELGAEGINHLVENHWDSGYDRIAGRNNKKNKNQRSKTDPRARKSRNQLPSPEPDRDRDRDRERERDFPPAAAAGAAAGYAAGDRRNSPRSDSLERSETSERITRAYEDERDDPTRTVHSVLSPQRRRRRDSARMSQANGYAPSRQRSQGPPRDRYEDDEASDYDEREGRRYRTSGRGYNDRDDRDYPYDREIIETERYKGVSGPLVASRLHPRADGCASHSMLTVLV